jgi:hypothetical protein
MQGIISEVSPRNCTIALPNGSQIKVPLTDVAIFEHGKQAGNLVGRHVTVTLEGRNCVGMLSYSVQEIG